MNNILIVLRKNEQIIYYQRLSGPDNAAGLSSVSVCVFGR